ncbi:MAG: rhombosortase [Opitutales bacterium]|jgi:rhomboid family GlyGly-CTERM serine protease|nr:rhombosortase [Opitutales bacterium]
MSKVADKSKQLPWISGVIGVAACFLALFPDTFASALQYDRELILEGEYWRLFTGHFVHWNSAHLLWDVVVFFACGLFLEWVRRSLWVSVLILAPVTISLALLVLQPDMNYYRGLSALDMSLFAAICLQAMSFCRLKKKSALLLMWGFAFVTSVLKPVMETVLGGTFFVSHFGEGVEASPLSHLLGVLVAVALFKAISFWKTVWNWVGCSHSFRSRKLSVTSIS